MKNIPDKIVELAIELHTQDNRITSHPIFEVQEIKRIPTDEGDDYEWRNTDMEVATPEQHAEFDAYFDDKMDFPEGWSKYYYTALRVPVQQFFTNKAAEKFIEDHGYDLKDPIIYVRSGYENLEWRLVRDYLMSLAPKGYKCVRCGVVWTEAQLIGGNCGDAFCGANVFKT